jgi:tagatose-1,6-bisphosphate aldolase non-catalytic subunit AgaZ/GatZ
VIRQHERYIGNADVPKSLNRYLLKNRSEMAPHYFSTIYDSGCCLGREILDEKVKLYLSEPQRIKKYVEKGTSEIHWEGNPKKKNHFELIKLIREEFPKEVNSAIEKVKKNIDKKRIVDLIQQIDCNLPEKLKEHKLTTERKELMIKLITLRAEKLIEL